MSELEIGAMPPRHEKGLRGSKPQDDGEKKTLQIVMKMNPREGEMADELAKKRGISRSELVRRLIRREHARENAATERAWAETSRLGNELALLRGVPFPGFDLEAELRKALVAGRDVPVVKLVKEIAKRELAADSALAKKQAQPVVEAAVAARKKVRPKRERRG